MHQIRTAEEFRKELEKETVPDLEIVSHWLKWFDEEHLDSLAIQDLKVSWQLFPRFRRQQHSSMKKLRVTKKEFLRKLQEAGYCTILTMSSPVSKSKA